jgi:hypothetical protein
MAIDMHALEDQFHPGCDFPAYSSAVEYYDSLDSVVPFEDFTVAAVTSDYLSDLPDLWVPDATDDVSSLPDLLPIDLPGGGPISHSVSRLSDIVYSSCRPTHVDNNTRNTQDQVPPNVVGLDEENAARELEVINSSIPLAPFAPVPGEEVIPQGQGPGAVSGSHEPSHPPRHSGWWFHVDTGANVHVTYFPDELAHRVHSAGHCGTAGTGTITVICEGMWVLQGNPLNCPDFHAVHTVLGCPGTKRRSLSLHALARAGYDCVHHVRSHVAIAHRATNTQHRLSCTTHRETDFVEPMPCKAALPTKAYGDVSAIDLAKTIKGPALFHLLHLQLGCIGADTLKRMISQ